MSGLLRAEVRKLAKRKIFWVMLLILAVVMGLGAVLLLVVSSVAPEAVPGLPVVSKPDAYLLGAQQAIGQNWFPIVLAAVVVGGEMRSAAFAASLVRDARRGAHLFARLTVLTAASWLATLVAVAGWALAVSLFAPGAGGPTWGEWVDVVWKSGLVELTWTALAIAAVALFRSLGPALGAALAFSFVEGILSLWEVYRPISLSTNSTGMLGELSEFSAGFGIGVAAAEPVPELQATVVVGIWAIGLVGLAWAALQLRDI